jgi:hypothetical protein
VNQLTGTAPNPLPQQYAYALDVGLVLPASAFAAMAAGHEAQLREDVASEWGVGNGDTISTTAVNLADGVPEGVSPIRVHAKTPPSAADSGALAEHGDDPDGDPTIDIYEDLIAQFGIGPECPTLEDAVAAAASHELVEQRLDPQCDRTATLPDGRVVAIEGCDQVQAQTYRKNGVCVSNFNRRSNYSIDSDAPPYDFLGNLTVQFQCAAGGYEQILDPEQGWKMITAEHVMQRGRERDLVPSDLGGTGGSIFDTEIFPRETTRRIIDSVPNGMLRYRLELAWRGIGRHVKRKRRHKRHAAAATPSAPE